MILFPKIIFTIYLGFPKVNYELDIKNYVLFNKLVDLRIGGIQFMSFNPDRDVLIPLNKFCSCFRNTFEFRCIANMQETAVKVFTIDEAFRYSMGCNQNLYLNRYSILKVIQKLCACKDLYYYDHYMNLALCMRP